VTSARALLGDGRLRVGGSKIVLTPIPCFASLTRESQADVVRRMFASIERGAREARRSPVVRGPSMRAVAP
jgi:hypothetical protein